jgi:hypothetical protein
VRLWEDMTHMNERGDMSRLGCFGTKRAEKWSCHEMGHKLGLVVRLGRPKRTSSDQMGLCVGDGPMLLKFSLGSLAQPLEQF